MTNTTAADALPRQVPEHQVCFAYAGTFEYADVMFGRWITNEREIQFDDE